MLRRVLRGAAESVLVRLPRRTAPGDRLILAYHNVVPADWVPSGDRSLHLPVDRFEAQLGVLQAEATVVSLMELLTTHDPHRRRVAITFDDAYASALTLGVAACQARGLPCTVFVAPGLLGRVPLWDRRAMAGRWEDTDRATFLWQHKGRDAEPVTAEEHGIDRTLRIATATELLSCVAQSDEGLTLGNHTVSHPNLAALGLEDVQVELRDAQMWLHTRTPERVIPVVAYPYGHAPRDDTWRVEHDVTLPRWGLRVTGGWQRNGSTLQPHALPRWNVPAGISLAGFAIRLRGFAHGG